LKAIKQLEVLLKKYKGTAQEPDLLYRLGELYMRRAKAGRFFDLYRSQTKVMSLIPTEVRNATAKSSIKNAIQIYDKIQKQFPKYDLMDEVLFNKAFAHNQINEKEKSVELYRRILAQFPNTKLKPECYVAMAELLYEELKFDQALVQFELMEQYPNNRLYSFSLYKGAWTLYNLKKTNLAMKKLEKLIVQNPKEDANKKGKQNLRTETLRDLSLFSSEMTEAEHQYSYFSSLLKDENELGEALISVAKIYSGHSRQKELIIVLNDLTEKLKSVPQLTIAYKLLSESSDELKQRDQALSYLTSLDKICKPDSSWKKANQTSAANEFCDLTLNSFNLELIKSWMSLWEKNPTHKEFALLTIKAFELYFGRENSQHPDNRSRFAYAELLFQVEDYDHASLEYDKVAHQIEDTKLKHDAAYGAIIALDKYTQKEKKKTDEDRMMPLLQFYLSSQKNGEFRDQVQYKVAFIHYENKRWDLALQNFSPLLSIKNKELKIKSEDLILDIYNSQKNYTALSENANKFRHEAALEKERSGNLLKIYQQAQLMVIQSIQEKGKELDAAHLFESFADEHKGSDEAIQALWKALSLNFSNGRSYEGAELAVKYSQLSRDQKQNEKALEQAATSYIEVGEVIKAAQTFEKLANLEKNENKKKERYWTALELYELTTNREDIERLFSQLFKSATKEETSLLISKQIALYKNQPDSAKYKAIMAKVKEQKLEPYYSDLLLTSLNEKMTQKKYTEAFESAKQIINGEGSQTQRAQAKLIQAKILENELVAQRVKAKVEKLAIVLSLKTEKLEKASSSYSSALKLADQAEFKVLALNGLKRCYDNYVQSISNLTLSEGVSTEDLNALKTELAKLTGPIAEKSQDVEKNLKELSQNINIGDSSKRNWSDYPVNKTIVSALLLPSYSDFNIYVPAWPDQSHWIKSKDLASATCNSTTINSQLSFETLSENINKCVKAENIKLIDDGAKLLAIKDPKSPWGSFYHALSAELNKNYHLAIWYLELSSKKKSEEQIITYNKSRLYFALGQNQQGVENMKKSFAQNSAINEQKIFMGLSSYQSGNCEKTVEYLNSFLNPIGSVTTKSSREITIAMSECFAKSGKVDEAISLLNNSLKNNKEPMIYFQKGHLLETYKKDSLEAKQVYEDAARKVTDDETKEWLNKKIAYLTKHGK
jgi:tetratricopeptide (TPR) repeat protein